MNVIATAIPDVLLIKPKVFSDERGMFWESFNERRFLEAAKVQATFVQDNHSISTKGALHGLHYQIKQPQAKLVRAVAGEIFDVAVDLRKASPTFGRWVGAKLSAQNKLQIWIPAGFAHGYLVKSASAEILYKVTDYYAPQHERSLAWNDPTICIDWPIEAPLMLSAKDKAASLFANAEVFE